MSFSLSTLHFSIFSPQPFHRPNLFNSSSNYSFPLIQAKGYGKHCIDPVIGGTCPMSNRTRSLCVSKGQVSGTTDRPRMCVFRSNKHLYVQVIDDTKYFILTSASTVQEPVSSMVNYTSGPTIAVARLIGEVIAKQCLEKGIKKVVFDRAGYLYHGRVKAIADAARAHGLDF